MIFTNTVQIILDRLEKLNKIVKQTDENDWMAQCPAHDDHKPSLHIRVVGIRDYKNPAEARFGLRRYFEHYNRRRRHRSLGRKTPAAVYGLAKGSDFDMMKTDGGRSAVAMALGSVALRALLPKSQLTINPCETVPP